MSVNKFKARLQAFRRDEAGSASIEALIWVPIFVFFLVLVIDVSFILFGRAQALQVVQDGNRKLAVGNFSSNNPLLEAQTFMQNTLAPYAPNAVVDFPTVDYATGVVTSVVSIPATDLMMVGSIPVFANTQIKIFAQHFLEL